MISTDKDIKFETVKLGWEGMDVHSAKWVQIDPTKYKGGIPTGFDLVIVENCDDGIDFNGATILYGFDELHLFSDDFQNPVWGFLNILD